MVFKRTYLLVFMYRVGETQGKRHCRADVQFNTMQ